jgi:hypothetical protein
MYNPSVLSQDILSEDNIFLAAVLHNAWKKNPAVEWSE